MDGHREARRSDLFGAGGHLETSSARPRRAPRASRAASPAPRSDVAIERLVSEFTRDLTQLIAGAVDAEIARAHATRRKTEPVDTSGENIAGAHADDERGGPVHAPRRREVGRRIAATAAQAPSARFVRAFGWRLDPAEPLVTTAEAARLVGISTRAVGLWFRDRGIERYADVLTETGRHLKCYRWRDLATALDRPDANPWVRRDPTLSSVALADGPDVLQAEWTRRAVSLLAPRVASAFVSVAVLGMTLEEVGAEIGVTRERVRQLVLHAQRRLRAAHEIAWAADGGWGREHVRARYWTRLAERRGQDIRHIGREVLAGRVRVTRETLGWLVDEMEPKVAELSIQRGLSKHVIEQRRELQALLERFVIEEPKPEPVRAPPPGRRYPRQERPRTNVDATTRSPISRPTARGRNEPVAAHLFASGLRALADGDLAACRALLEQAAEAGNHDASVRLIVLLVQSLGDDGAALASEARLSGRARQRADVRAALGIAAARSGDEARALELLDRVRHASAAIGWVELGRHAVRAGDYDRAANFARRARVLDRQAVGLDELRRAVADQARGHLAVVQAELKRAIADDAPDDVQLAAARAVLAVRPRHGDAQLVVWDVTRRRAARRVAARAPVQHPTEIDAGDDHAGRVQVSPDPP